MQRLVLEYTLSTPYLIRCEQLSRDICRLLVGQAFPILGLKKEYGKDGQRHHA